MRVIVLGSSGMLGQAVVRQAASAGIETLQISRGGEISWDYFRTPFDALASDIGILGTDVLVNCVGWIPQKATGEIELDRAHAHQLNVGLISEIESAQALSGFSWIQILTDCVFDGKSGGYLENAPHSAVDLYGTTKSLGERHMSTAMKIRCSIIGPDRNHGSGLFEWLRSQPYGAVVEGFENHFWNGVSTLAFSRLVVALAAQNLVNSDTQHWVPRNSVSKFELLKIFKAQLARADLTVDGISVGESVDRRLFTAKLKTNDRLWTLAGYKEVPTVEQMCDEFIDWDLREGGQQ